MFNFREKEYYNMNSGLEPNFIYSAIEGRFNNPNEYIDRVCKKFHNEDDLLSLKESIQEVNNLFRSYASFDLETLKLDDRMFESLMISIGRTAFLLDLNSYNDLTPDEEDQNIKTVPHISFDNIKNYSLRMISTESILDLLNTIEKYFNEWYIARTNHINDEKEKVVIFDSRFKKISGMLKTALNTIISKYSLDLDLINNLYYLTSFDYERLNDKREKDLSASK